MRLKFRSVTRRQGLDGQGLGQAGHAFEQEMPRGQQGDHHPLQQLLLPDDDLGHFGHGLFDDQALFLDLLVDERQVLGHLVLLVVFLAVIRARDLDAAGHFEKAAADAAADAFAQGLFAADLFIEKIAGEKSDAIVVVTAIN